MKLCLIDTNIFSYWYKGHELWKKYAPELHGSSLYISYITQGEALLGAEQRRWGAARIRELKEALAHFEVLEHRVEIAHLFAQITAGEERHGRSISFPDAWIAATAMAYGIPLVTHNRKDFESIEGLVLFSKG